jgi:hypothetical protein
MTEKQERYVRELQECDLQDVMVHSYEQYLQDTHREAERLEREHEHPTLPEVEIQNQQDILAAQQILGRLGIKKGSE